MSKTMSSIKNWLTPSSSAILSSDQLARLSQHKYSCVSESLVDPHMQPWWNWFVTKLPLWLAPNLITITGLLVNMITSMILFYYSPDGRQEAPSYAPLACAVGIFVYQTLDAVDGKQARRTGSSSALGELFDHGCDSLSTVFVALAACTTCGLGTEPWCMFLLCFSFLTLFYCAHWRAYVSGSLHFGRVDVTEAQLSIMALHVISATFGRPIWAATLFGWQLKHVATAFIGIVAGYLFFFEYMAVILKGGAGPNGSTIAGTSILSPVTPLFLLVWPAYSIAYRSHSGILHSHPCLYIMCFGIMAAKVTNKLVVAHMTRSRIQVLDSVLVVPALLLANQYFGYFFSEYHLLWLCLVIACCDLLAYCRRLCSQIAESLGVQVFRIAAPKSSQ